MTHIEGQDARLVVISFPLERELPNLDALTAAEQDVAKSAARGLSNKAIAQARGTSEYTVSKQLASIYRKLGVDSRRQLRMLASTAEAVEHAGGELS
ncbi:MAG: helix-turn-helix transcriptional regulator [Myxococcales bacterium]